MLLCCCVCEMKMACKKTTSSAFPFLSFTSIDQNNAQALLIIQEKADGRRQRRCPHGIFPFSFFSFFHLMRRKDVHEYEVAAVVVAGENPVAPPPIPLFVFLPSKIYDRRPASKPFLLSSSSSFSLKEKDERKKIDSRHFAFVAPCPDA